MGEIQCRPVDDGIEIRTSCSTLGDDMGLSDISPAKCLSEQVVVGLGDEECADILLVRAVMTGELGDVHRALNLGATVDTTAGLTILMNGSTFAGVQGVTPLMRACALGFAEIVDCLLAVNANLFEIDNQGWTPLCHACGAGELFIARRLLVRASASSNCQRAILNHLRSQIISHCEESAGEDRVQALREAFSENGFLSLGCKRV